MTQAGGDLFIANIANIANFWGIAAALSAILPFVAISGGQHMWKSGLGALAIGSLCTVGTVGPPPLVGASPDQLRRGLAVAPPHRVGAEADNLGNLGHVQREKGVS